DPALVVVIRRIDDQRVALPSTSRIPVPLFGVGWQMRPPIEWNDSRLVNHLRQNDYGVGRLHDLIRVVVASGEHSCRNSARNASIPDAHEFVRIRVVGGVVVTLGFRLRLHRYSSILALNDGRSSPALHDFSPGIKPKLLLVSEHR